jgi:hypothetical protein
MATPAHNENQEQTGDRDNNKNCVRKRLHFCHPHYLYEMDPTSDSNTATTPDDDDATLSTHPLLTQDTRQVLASLHFSKLHLANPSLLDQVQWAPRGRGFVLVMKEKTKNKFCVAKLDCVGELTPDKFWLHPCGGWVGPNGPANNWAKATPFEKTRARGCLRRPQHPHMHDHWATYLSNLDAILALATSNAKDTRVEHSIVEGKEIKIRHSVFMVRNICVTYRDASHLNKKTPGKEGKLQERPRRAVLNEADAMQIRRRKNCTGRDHQEGSL